MGPPRPPTLSGGGDFQALFSTAEDVFFRSKNAFILLFLTRVFRILRPEGTPGGGWVGGVLPPPVLKKEACLYSCVLAVVSQVCTVCIPSR